VEIAKAATSSSPLEESLLSASEIAEMSPASTAATAAAAYPA
jgi:hypothetical protein